jgi:Asp-tRNA(Asn)/Glu-tRNA(Gln) amidotransferase A subunit family amidase
LATGTDGGGSIRIPAGFCGIVGLKPTYGRVPLYPSSPFGTLAHAGPMTRTVDDAALMLDVLSGPDARDWSALPPPIGSFRDHLDDGVGGLRVAFSPALGYVDVDNEVATAVRAAVDVLAGLGARVTEVDPGFADPVRAYHVLWFSGAAKALEHLSPNAAERLDPGLPEVVAEGRTLSALDELDAVHLPLQPHAATRCECPMWPDHRRVADRAADRRTAARRYAGPGGGQGLRGCDVGTSRCRKRFSPRAVVNRSSLHFRRLPGRPADLHGCGSKASSARPSIVRVAVIAL